LNAQCFENILSAWEIKSFKTPRIIFIKKSKLFLENENLLSRLEVPRY
jgi:hypothetical protein